MRLLTLFADQKGTALAIMAVFALLLLLPLLGLLPSGSSCFLSAYWITLIGKIMCYALVALALDLVWGYAGILSLGHGLYFALGGYCFGMYLMREANPDSLPPFMVFLDWKALPWYWTGSNHFWFAGLMVILVPGLLAFIFGFFAFRSKIKGVYFAIITQALTFAATLLFFRNETGFGGNNGFTGFTTIFGYSITAPATRVTLCMLTAFCLMACYIGLRYLLSLPFGRVLGAVRDSENRLRFLGYRTQWYKLSAWTLSAIIAGVAGALYVPQVGIINPSEMGTSNSIEMAVWVAMGGRGTLIGPLFGAGLVNVAKSYFTVAYPEMWLLLLGSLFIVVTLFLPQGLVGLYKQLVHHIPQLKAIKPHLPQSVQQPKESDHE